GQDAVATAVSEKSKLAHAVRLLHQTIRSRAASVRHADATTARMMVSQFIQRLNSAAPCVSPDSRRPREALLCLFIHSANQQMPHTPNNKAAYQETLQAAGGNNLAN